MARRWIRADDTLAAGPATPLRARDGERGLAVSWWRHRGRGLGAVACSRQPEMREDPVNDGGVVDRGDQLHPHGKRRQRRTSRSNTRRIKAAHVQ